MKKISLFFLILIILSARAFSYNWFDDRYVELSIGSKFGLSNDALQIGEVLKKNVVLDLRKMADQIPSSGITMTANMLPEISLNFRFKKFQLGFKTASDVWMTGSLSKDLFDYLGKGNTLNQTVSISQSLNVDAFAYEEVSVGFKLKEFKIVAKPTLFVPVLHAGSRNGTLNLSNLSDGSLNVDYSSDIEIYSAYPIAGGGGFKGGFGFDLGASVSYPLLEFLTLTGNARLPIVPGQLKYKTVQTTTMQFTTTVDKIINGSLGSNNFSSSHGDSVSASYFINRPMKFSIFADYKPPVGWLILTGGLGMGFRHPFTEDKDSFAFFGEYYLSGTLKFLKFLSFTFSTEYYEQIFIHQFSFSVNARVIELVLGINAQSADFYKSCSGGGLGGLFAVKLGY